MGDDRQGGPDGAGLLLQVGVCGRARQAPQQLRQGVPAEGAILLVEQVLAPDRYLGKQGRLIAQGAAHGVHHRGPLGKQGAAQGAGLPG
ncbi:MAG: hypothetical protein RMK29_19515 [Myxococcales bacterium]|nr:hypothetical protein [Myxococcota bacterium]MDW8283896.1 hypothetical protein [Myxococcales bacterium]